MKILKILFSSFIVILLGISVNGQNVTKLKGTIGKEKPEKMLVICVFGTKSCMPVEIDPEMKAEADGRLMYLKDLPVGLYIEAEIIGRNKLKSIKTDINKTVICFSELNAADNAKLNELLNKTKGVHKFQIYSKSLQVYIEFDHDKISYVNLEKLIMDKGFKLE